MSNHAHKHIKELFYASSVIKELGFSPDETMCADRPDIVLPSVENRRIGIEVVTYSTQCHEEAGMALQKILNEYAWEILDKRTEKRFEIQIHLMDLAIPTNIKYQTIKNEIFKELDSLILPEQPRINRMYIEQVDLMELPNLERSHISCVEAYLYDTLNENVLLTYIQQKEQKLKEYKSLDENQTIQEYYLVIFFPLEEGAELREYTLPNTYKTAYDRIYLVDLFYCNRIV